MVQRTRSLGMGVAAGLLALGCGGNASKSGSTTMTASVAVPPGVADYLTVNPGAPESYATTYPRHYDAQVLAQDNTPADNPLTDKGATLGRVLFFDKRLSVNDTVACASCHQQALGHGDSAQFSAGFAPGLQTAAHAMRLPNARFYGPGSMFWDKRAPTLEFQTTQPIQSSVEMGFDAAHGGIAALLEKMKGLPYYPELFTAVYGDGTITEARIQKALAQYVRAMTSTRSRFDDGAVQTYDPNAPGKGIGAPKANFSASENRGQQLFFAPKNQGGAGCAGCHQPPSFALAANSLSNGLAAGETRIFKSASLKSVSLTGPYMHDGSLTDLAAVIAHYDHGIQDGPALDNRLKGPDGQPQRLGLSATDQTALVDFLRTLRDDGLAADIRFTNPFKK